MLVEVREEELDVVSRVNEEVLLDEVASFIRIKGYIDPLRHDTTVVPDLLEDV